MATTKTKLLPGEKALELCRNSLHYGPDTMKATSDELEDKLGAIKWSETYDDPVNFETTNVYYRLAE